MERKWERTRVICFAASLILTAAAFLSVYYLTQQSVSQTLSTQERAVELFPFAFPKHYHNRLWLYLQLNSPRRLAHIYEFGLLGAFGTLAALTDPWPRRGGSHLPLTRVGVRMIAAVAFCSAVSFFDQVHKLFVVSRHFDVLDLRLDAIGYVSAALVVSILYLIITHHALRRTERFLEEAIPCQGRRGAHAGELPE